MALIQTSGDNGSNSATTLFYNSFGDFPATGAVNFLYVAKSTAKLYEWDADTLAYVEFVGDVTALMLFGKEDNAPNENRFVDFTNKGKTLTILNAPSLPFTVGNVASILSSTKAQFQVAHNLTGNDNFVQLNREITADDVSGGHRFRQTDGLGHAAELRINIVDGFVFTITDNDGNQAFITFNAQGIIFEGNSPDKRFLINANGEIDRVNNSLGSPSALQNGSWGVFEDGAGIVTIQARNLSGTLKSVTLT